MSTCVDKRTSRAAAESRTFTSLVEEGLRSVLAEPDESVGATRLPAYGEPGGKVLVDLTGRDALWEVLDADGAR